MARNAAAIVHAPGKRLFPPSFHFEAGVILMTENSKSAQRKSELSRKNNNSDPLPSDASSWVKRCICPIFDSVEEPVYIADPETYEILYANKALNRLFGNVTGKKCHTALHGLPFPCTFCTNHLIFGEHEGTSHTWDFRNSKNKRWYRCIDRAIPWFDGRPVRCEMAVDISALRNDEQALRRERDYYRSFLDALTDWVWEIDVSGCISYSNPAVERMLGFRIPDILHSYFGDIWVSDSAEIESRKRLEERIASRREWRTLTGRYRHRNGTDVITESTAFPLFDEHHRFIGYRGFDRDISDRMRKERELHERRLYLEAILNAVPDAIITLDTDHRVVEWNIGATRLFGYTHDEVIGKNLDHLISLPNQQSDTHDLTALILSGTPVHPRESIRYRKDGSPVAIIVSGSPILVNNECIGVVGVYTDISALKKSEIERADVEAQLLQSQKMEAVGRLAGGISHDFNNLLTAILGYSQLALNKSVDYPGFTLYLKEIVKSGERAASLTRQLLAFSRKQDINPLNIDLNRLISDMDGMLRPLLGENVERIIKTDSDLPNVRADPRQIEQVIMNLVINARDAMPDGGTLTIQTMPIESSLTDHPITDKTYCRVSIRDTGFGIDSQTSRHIFEPFFTTKEGGTGLGLSVAYGIVKQHDGWIEVESIPDTGSSFHVYLPASLPGEEISSVLRGIQRDLRGSGETILIVDDDEAVRKFMKTVLEEYGYSVLQAADANTASLIAKDNPISLRVVISDVVLPDGSGVDLAREMMELYSPAHIILTSGYGMTSSHQEFIRENSIPFLPKPFTVEDLLEAAFHSLNTEDS